MGMIGRILGAGPAMEAVGQAATGLAEVFTPNATRKLELDAAAHGTALDQFGAEFAIARPGVFDSLINGVNRLPRPFLALGTMALFVYAMVDPPGFGLRMAGLAEVPEPLWWLLGAIVSFYFGAREAHYYRIRKTTPATAPVEAPVSLTVKSAASDFSDNAALRDWAAGQ